MKRIILFISTLLFLGVSCVREEGSTSTGLDSIENPRADKLVSKYGETVSVTFQADGAWTAALELKTGEGWAEISQIKGNEAAGKGTVRINFSANEGDERSAELYVSVEDREPELAAVFTQAAGESISGLSAYLNDYMHKRLLEEYLWADEYAGLDVDMKASYDQFLPVNLGRMRTNNEDGGYFRDNTANPGQRYIYSQISEVTSTKTYVATRSGSLPSAYGLGIASFYASLMEQGKDAIMLTVSYVYPDSPAAEAGLRRGDCIFNVNGIRLTQSNYETVASELTDRPDGSYDIRFLRFDPDEAQGKYVLNEYSVSVAPGTFGYNPVIYSDVMSVGGVKIGYMVLESFDSSTQPALEKVLGEFIEAGIDEFILDLRFNTGGEVQQSRYLASSIAGRGFDDMTFCDLQFNDGSLETWKFRSGPNEVDKLGVAPEIPGLDRLWVIMSERTASASELIINGLEGVGFSTVLIGSRSEGKNVGMVVSQTVYEGRRFEFAPVTYRALNAEGESGPHDGFTPHEGFEMNNQNTSTSDDLDNMFPYSFGDWGNIDFNIALQYACAGIYGSVSSSVRSYPSPFIHVAPLPEKERPLGRFGNAVYLREL